MSKFRDRAAEVKAAGEEARGDFTPNGVPKRMYQWWLENSPSVKAAQIATGERRENFCHFWRVVVIWVPLLWLAEKILNPVFDAAERVNPKYALVAVGVLVLGIAALIATTTGTWMEVLTVLGWGLGLAAVAAAIATLIYFLNEKTEHGVEILFATVAVLAGIGVFIAAVIDFGFWMVLMWIGIVVVTVVAFFAAAIFIGTVIEHLRADAKKRREAALEVAYEAYLAGDGPSPYDRPARTKREPGKVSKFFSGIGDFLTLAAQVVRVNKWKICPLVEVDVPAKKIDPNSGWETA